MDARETMRTWVVRLCAVLAAAGFLVAILLSQPNIGHAQAINTTSETATDTIVIGAPTTTTVQVNDVSTTIEGKLIGGSLLYDQTFPDPFSDPAVQAGVAAARLAITTAGGPGVVIVGPTLISTTSSTVSNTTSVYTLDHIGTTVTVTTTIGPATLATGDRTSCSAAIATLPSSTRPVCGPVPAGTTVNVVAGGENINTTVMATYFVDEADTTTNTTTTNSTYLLQGTVRPIGTVHTQVDAAGFDADDRFLRRMLDAAGGEGATAPTTNGDPFWLEGYGQWVTVGSQHSFPGANVQTGGINGGFDYHFANGITFGGALDYNNSTIDENAAGEHGSLDLFQVGLYGGWRSGGWFADVSGSYGWGSASTSVAPIPMLGTAVSHTSPSVGGLFGELGDHLMAGNVIVTPSAGAAWMEEQSGAFTETGSMIALAGPSHSYNRYKGWLGLAAQTTTGAPATGAWTFAAYGRVLALGGDNVLKVPVTFVGSPTVLVIDGADIGSFGGDLGASIAYRFGRSVQAYGAYDARLRDHYTSQTASVGLKIDF
jgi:uncharacterized protein with beta-barrel porin domain